MNYTMFDTEFMGTCQSMSLDKSGNEYYISIGKGGFKYKDTEFEDEKFDCGCSPKFKDYESAFLFYSKLLFEFGQGNYGWEDRKRMVQEGAAK